MARSGLVQRLVFPGVLLGSVGGAVGAVRLGLPEVPVVCAITVLVALALLVAQVRVRPELLEVLRREGPTDLLHMVLSNGLVGSAFRLATLGAFIWLAEHHTGVLWPHYLPLPLELLLALLAGEAAFYTVHRLAHEHEALWRFHAVHHSSEELTVLSSARNHPVNALASTVTQTVPALILGAGPEVLVALSVFTTVHGMLQHADLGLRFGVLNKVFATAEVHHWHHSAVASEGHANYGSNLVIFDLLFGTWRVPEGQPRPPRMGLLDAEIPRGFWAHLRVPFAWERLVRLRDPEEVAAAEAELRVDARAAAVAAAAPVTPG